MKTEIYSIIVCVAIWALIMIFIFTHDFIATTYGKLIMYPLFGLLGFGMGVLSARNQKKQL